MKDKHLNDNLTLGRTSGPYSVAFTVTGKCNYKCKHCYNNSGDDFYNDVSDEQLLKITDQICELRPISVCLCGGEPLIRGDVIYTIIKKLSSCCGIVNIVSNGSLINNIVLDKLKACGINTIQISLDGDTPFLHDNLRMRSGAFNHAIEAIRLSATKGFRVAVSCCPSKLNKLAIKRTCKLVKLMGANEFRLMPLILMGRGESLSSLKLNADEYLTLQQELEKLKRQYNDSKFSVSWGDPLDHLFRMPHNAKIGMSTYSMEIRNDGKLTVSTYLPIIVGDLNKHTLKEYWDAGYNTIWGNEDVIKYIKSISSTSQFNNFIPKPYQGKDIEIQLIKE